MMVRMGWCPVVPSYSSAGRDRGKTATFQRSHFVTSAAGSGLPLVLHCDIERRRCSGCGFRRNLSNDRAKVAHQQLS